METPAPAILRIGHIGNGNDLFPLEREIEREVSHMRINMLHRYDLIRHELRYILDPTVHRKDFKARYASVSQLMKMPTFVIMLSIINSYRLHPRHATFISASESFFYPYTIHLKQKSP